MTQLKLIKILTLCLCLSLAGNFFLGGYMAGNDITPPPASNTQNAQSSQNQTDRVNRYLNNNMTNEDRQILRTQMQTVHSSIQESNQNLRRNMAEIKDILQAETLDEAALAESFENMRSHYNDAATATQDAFIEAIIEMSPEGRKALADSNVLFRAAGLQSTEMHRTDREANNRIRTRREEIRDRRQRREPPTPPNQENQPPPQEEGFQIAP